MALPISAERLRRRIRYTAATLVRTSPVHAVIPGATGSDAEFELLDRCLQADRFVAHVQLIGPMLGSPATDDEVETFSALTSADLPHPLTVTLRWTQQRFAEWLEQTVTSLLTAAETAET